MSGWNVDQGWTRGLSVSPYPGRPPYLVVTQWTKFTIALLGDGLLKTIPFLEFLGRSIPQPQLQFMLLLLPSPTEEHGTLIPILNPISK